MTAATDVLAIGNAIVDVIASQQEQFLADNGLTKGAMQLVSPDRAAVLYEHMGPGREISGGSAANTAVGVVALGGTAAFIGRTADDQLGQVFAHDIRASGVDFRIPPAADGSPTGRCLIVVTPDAQRTMNTCLGAACELDEGDIDESLVRAAGITYFEGYLWDVAAPIRALRKAAAIAGDAGRKLAFTLSDTFCVERHRSDFLGLIEGGDVDIVFANENEANSLFKTGRLEDAISGFAARNVLAVVTRSEKGAIIIRGDERHAVSAEPVRQVVDTTGAGDLFAAGFLTGLMRQLPLDRCAHMGAVAAAEVISHYGARPEQDLRALVEARLGAA